MSIDYFPKCGLEQTFPRLRDEQLEDFEETLGFRLPEEYREFLRQWNGVQFFLDRDQKMLAFPVQPIDDHSSTMPSWDEWVSDRRRSIDDSINDVTLLYGIGPEVAMSLSKDQPGYGFELWVPNRFLAIGGPAYDIGHICLSLAGYDCGNIYYWTKPEDIPMPGINCPNMDYMSWVAPNFREFWDALLPLTEEEAEEWGK